MHIESIVREGSRTLRATARPMVLEKQVDFNEQRRIWAAGIKTAKDQEARKLSVLRAEEEKAAKVVRDLQAQLEGANQKLSEVRTRESAVSNRTHRMVGEYEFSLRASCSPAIAGLREKMTRLRSQLANKIAYQEGINQQADGHLKHVSVSSIRGATHRRNSHA